MPREENNTATMPSRAKTNKDKGEGGGPLGKKNRLLFIVSSNADKVDPETRKRIRSHARREARPNVRRAPKKSPGPTSTAVVRRAPDGRTTMDEVVRTFVPLLPGRVGSDLSFVEFSAPIEPWRIHNMMRVSSVIVNIMYPLLSATSCRMDVSQVLDPLALDATALHINAFAIEIFICRVLRGQEENTIHPSAYLHLRRGLHLLRERLSREDDDKEKLSNSTMAVVAKLVSAACFDGDAETASKHMQGLRRIADLRGGIDSIDGKSQIELFRCDLTVAFLSCSTPVFCRQPLEPLPRFPETLLPPSERSSDESTDGKHSMVVCGDMEVRLRASGHHDLATVWHVLRRFCLNANLGAQTQRLVYPAIVHQTMISTTHRLLSVHYASGSTNESIRLGLLAFCYHIFLQWQDMRLPQHRFHAVYEACLRGLDANDAIPPHVKLWLLMVGAVSLWRVEHTTWLAEALRRLVDVCAIQSCKDMQRRLASTMWITRLDEVSGPQIWDVLVPPKGKNIGKTA